MGTFLDSYSLEWTLRDDEGNEWSEYHNNMSLSDFEILYGQTTYHFVKIELKQQRGVVHE